MRAYRGHSRETGPAEKLTLKLRSLSLSDSANSLHMGPRHSTHNECPSGLCADNKSDFTFYLSGL